MNRAATTAIAQKLNSAFAAFMFVLCFSASMTFVFSQSQLPDVQSNLAKFALELFKAPDETAQIVLLERNPSLINAELFESVARSGGNEMAGGNFRAALKHYSLAKLIAEKTKNQNQIARATREAAIAEFQLNGDFTMAFEKFRQSLKIFEELGDRKGIAKTLNSFGVLNLSQGEYQKALEYFRQSLERTDAETEKPEIARTLNNIGIVQRRLGNYQESLAAFNQSLKITDDLKMNRQSAHTLNNLQAVYQEQGNYRLALVYLQKALAFEELRGDRDFQARLTGNIGEIYFLQGDYEQSLRYFQDSLQIGESIGDKWLNHQLELKISRVYKVQGNFEEALNFAGRSLKASERIGDQPGKSASLTEIGNINLARHKSVEALDFFERALQINESIGDRAAAASALIGIAVARSTQNQFEKALLSALRSEELSEKIGNAEILWQARTVAGRAFRALGKTGEAHKYFSDAIDVIEFLRGQTAGSERERELFFENKLEPFHQLIEIFIEQKNFAAALESAERAKGRVLLDVLESGKADVAKSLTTAERAEEQILRGAIVTLNLQLAGENAKINPNRQKIAALYTQLNAARDNYRTFQTNLFAAHPQLQLQRGAAEPFNFQRMAKMLPVETAFLEFIVTDKKVFLAVIKNETAAPPSLKIYPLAVEPQRLGEQIRNFRGLLAARNLDYQEQARILFDVLLKPAASEISGSKTLCIIPDEFLWELPFQALSGADDKFLIETKSIYYVSSLGVLQATRKVVENNNSRSILALGNPALKQTITENTSKSERSLTAASLTNAEREVRGLGKIYGARQSLNLSGARATEAAFKKESGKYGILHFATHAVLETDNPLYSRILLGESADGGDEDGMLETWEILEMDLRAELVVLSACETGRGRIGAGEGVIGISWAFLVAGTPTVLVSQWKVDSASTTELMISFHRELNVSGGAKRSKAFVLQAAAKSLLKDKRYRHPFYWAGFVLVGNGQN